MSGQREVRWDFLVHVIIPTARKPGYVLLGSSERVHQHVMAGSRKTSALEIVPAYENEAVHQALEHGLLHREHAVRVTLGGGPTVLSGWELAVTTNSAQAAPDTRTCTYRGQEHRIEVGEGDGGPGTHLEHWPGRGVIGTHRQFNGSRYAKSLTWYATINPTGEPLNAGSGVVGLASRRAALDWLFSNTTTPDN